jgi:transposase InsO family protein
MLSHLHVDIVGLLPVLVGGSSYILTVIDRKTRWVEAIPSQNIEEATCSDAFISGWVSRFGVPVIIPTVKGTQFFSSTWSAMCQKLDIQHITTTAYHPQSKGVVEQVHRQMKSSLKGQCHEIFYLRSFSSNNFSWPQ